MNNYDVQKLHSELENLQDIENSGYASEEDKEWARQQQYRIHDELGN
jgi:hypothetical protein